jgi:hypothetical protein
MSATNTSIDLKGIEQRAWLSTFQDGLWDFYLGMLLLAGAVGTFLDDMGASDAVRIPSYVSVMVLGMMALFVGKRLITAPRIGRVKFGKMRKERSIRISLVIGITVLIMAVVFWMGYARQERGLPPIIPGDVTPSLIIILLILGAFTLLAYYWGLRRMYVYAILMATPEILKLAFGKLAGIDIGFIASAIPAAIILTISVVIFIRFLRTHPVVRVDDVPAEETGNG